MSDPEQPAPSEPAIVFDRIPADHAQAIREIPSYLADDAPDAVKRRLFPVPGDDAEEVREWRQKQHPELYALIASAREVVVRDLASISESGADGRFRLVIPEARVDAWISALNAARLALGALHDVVAADMTRESAPSEDARGDAIRRIDLYANIQAELIHLSGD